MNVLEKILEEIDRLDDPYFVGYIDRYKVKEIIRSHMDEVKNDGWIPVEERLPEVGKIVKVTVHSSEWISDHDSDFVPEEEKVYHPEEYHVHDGYLSRNGTWTFYDEEYSENTCEKEFGTDRGRIYDVVTGWQPLPEPYKPK